VRCKGFLQFVFGGVERQITNKQFGTHAMFSCLRVAFAIPNCSRPPGFKSSLNSIQLKIHQVSEATSYLNQTWRIFPNAT
jgi:hypothetical protein